ncbi:MAG: hypothetical protein PHZ02_07165 [Desulfocapsaceae bacterium]|nr:hypothetical protein [Desulfocapsaceae bacterium]
MKVDVLTVDDVVFKKWRWWSNWIDIAVFDYTSEPFLIQMRISRTNSKKFKAVNITGMFYRQTTTTIVGDLTQMSRTV